MEKKYFAFISYRRQDEKQAEWLHHKLVHYKLSLELRRKNPKLPKSPRSVFRDALELSSGVLAREIEIALNDSKYLIVVCSPNSAKSPCVNKEVEHFINTGREEYIIPFIIDGVPFSNDSATECFPEALRNLRGSRELLGIGTGELEREAAVVKVVAHMFGLKFDTLWQGYNREQRRKRMAWAVAAMVIVFASLAVAGVVANLNSKVKAQYSELNERQHNLLITQSKYLVSEAQKEYDKGNITKALRMALYALLKSLDNPDRPYVLDAEIMLRKADMYDVVVEDSVFCKTILGFGSAVYSAFFSPDGKYILTASEGNTARVWPFPPLPELIDRYPNDTEADWSLSDDEKREYNLE